MDKLTFTNSIGEIIVFDKKAPYLLQTIDGTGGTGVTNQSLKAPYQDGQTAIDSLLEPRVLPIQVAIMAKNETELFDYRKYFQHVLNPKLGEGTLKYEYAGGVKEIKCKVEQMPVFGSGRDTRGNTFQITIFSLICYSPFWLDIDELEEPLIAWIGKLEFPFEFPIEFGERANRATIFNAGDVETPCIIQFKGAATNPIVTNETTGEYIKVNRTLAENDVLEVNTAFGQKRVEIINTDGTRTNVFNYIDLNSTFFSLITGENVIVYNSDNPNNDASVSIKFKNRYIGL